MHFEIAVVGIGLAGKQRLKLLPRRLILQFLERGFGFGDDGLIFLRLAEFDQPELVIELALDPADAVELIFQRGALLHHLCARAASFQSSGSSASLFSSARRIFELIEVKDASSAARATA